MSTPRTAFTLLEICLTLAIGAILILLAAPSVSGMLAEQRLQESYQRFVQFANTARSQSQRDQKPCILSWDHGGIAMISTERDAKGAPVVIERFPFSKDETFHVSRPAAMAEKAAEEWVFWSNGVCEPVIISYEGPAGRWQVSFDALTTHGTFLRSETL